MNTFSEKEKKQLKEARVTMTKYLLTLEAEKLRRVSVVKQGKPYALVTVSGGPREGEILGKTEAQHTLDNIRFTTAIEVETDQASFLPIQVDILDYRDGRDETKMAEANFEVIGIHHAEAHTQYEENHKTGAIIRATVVESTLGPHSGVAKMQFRLLNTKNIEDGVLGLGRSDPFMELERKISDHESGVTRWALVYKSAHIDNNLNPVFQPTEVPMKALCQCNLKTTLRIVVKDWQRNQKHRLLGTVETNMEDLMQRIAKSGNADRSGAMSIKMEGDASSTGLVVVLQAKIFDV